MREEFV
jgi:hypothetical protein